MKAIILERRGDYAAVLCEDGTFANRRVGGEVGETIELAAEVVAFPAKRRWMRGAVAAMLALAITGGTLGYMGGTASAYVSLDLDEDSAIELTVNHFGRVIAVNALSDDTAELAASLTNEVRHRRAEDALPHTMRRLREEGYLGDTDAAVVAGVTSDDAKRATELKQSVENAVGDENELFLAEASWDERRQAMEQHRSAGRFAFERDHGEDFPTALRNGREQPEATLPAPQEMTDETGPAVPASEPAMIEHNTPSENETRKEQENTRPDQPPRQNIGAQPPVRAEVSEPPQGEAPQNHEQPAPEQSQPPQDGAQPAPEQEQQPQDGEQLTPEQEQQPQDGEQPAPEQEQPPQDGARPAPEQEQQPQDGEQLTPEQEQQPQDGEQPAPEQEQPPQDGGQHTPGQDRSPQNGEPGGPGMHDTRG